MIFLANNVFEINNWTTSTNAGTAASGATGGAGGAGIFTQVPL